LKKRRLCCPAGIPAQTRSEKCMPLKNTCLIKEVWIKLVDNYRYKWLMGENPTKGIICMMALNQVEW